MLRAAAAFVLASAFVHPVWNDDHASVREIVTRHPGERVLVVAHKGTLRLAICSWLGLDPRGYRDRLDQAPGCLNVFDFEGPVRARMALFNDTSHIR